MNAIAERDTWFEINLQSWKEIPEIRSTNQPHKEHILWNGYFLTVSTGGSERERSFCLWEVDLIRRSFFADDLSEFSEKEKIVSGEFGGWEILTDELALFWDREEQDFSPHTWRRISTRWLVDRWSLNFSLAVRRRSKVYSTRTRFQLRGGETDIVWSWFGVPIGIPMAGDWIPNQ